MPQRAQSQQRPPAGGRASGAAREATAPGFRFAKKERSSTTCASEHRIARSDPRRFAASILDSILGGSASSRLFQEDSREARMAYSVYSFASQFTDTGSSHLLGTREENLDVREIPGEQLADIAAGNLRPEEIARAKRI